MKWFSAIAMSLLLIIIGLVVEAHAVTSGVYKCYAFQGPLPDASTAVLPIITHYNPNATGVQSITRIRLFDSQGNILYDQAFPPGTLTVHGHGSASSATVSSVSYEGVQAIVNWRQAADGLAPIPRLTLLLFDTTTGNYTSASQSNC